MVKNMKGHFSSKALICLTTPPNQHSSKSIVIFGKLKTMRKFQVLDHLNQFTKCSKSTISFEIFKV